MIKVGNAPAMNESVSLEDIQNAKHKGNDLMKDGATLQIDKKVFTKYNKNEWSESTAPDGMGTSYTDKDVYRLASKGKIVKLTESIESINEAVDATTLKKGQWVVVNIAPRLMDKCNLVAVKIETIKSKYSIVGWAWAERLHDYSAGSIKYVAKSEEDAEKFIKDNKGKTVAELNELKESVEMNESSDYDEFVKANKNNDTYKKCASLCTKYGYELAPLCYVEVGKTGKLYVNFGIMHPPKGTYLPEIRYERGRFKIQTTSYGSLELDDYSNFMRACTSAQNLVKELSKIDLTKLNQIPLED